MRDCANVEMREALPDLVNDNLTTAHRAAVEAHVAACGDCRAELAVIESARRLLGRAPSVVVTHIVERLPAPAPAMRRRAVAWRIAAGIVLVAAAGAALASRGERGTDAPRELARSTAPAPLELPAESAPHVDGPPSRGAATRTMEPVALSLGGDLSELSDDQVRQLLGAVDALETLPRAEPEMEPPLWTDDLVEKEGAE